MDSQECHTEEPDQYIQQSETYDHSRKEEWVRVVEIPSVKQALGDIRGLKCLDLACGSGFYTRQMKRWGAEEVIGIDLSPEMIHLAKENESKQNLGITYVVRDCEHLEELNLMQRFDVVFGGWMIPYLPTTERLERFAENIRLLLKKGGKTVQLFGHEDRLKTGHFSAALTGITYHSEKQELQDGDCYNVTIASHGNEEEVHLTNYHYRHETVQRCFQQAGFAVTNYTPLMVKTGSEDQKQRYQALLDYPEFVVFEAINA